MAKGEEESWFRTKDAAAAMDHRDTMSVRVSNSAQDVAAKRPYSVDAASIDGEDNHWFPRGGRRKVESLLVEGATTRPKGRPTLRRSPSALLDQAAVVLCCCGPRWGSSKYNTMEGHTPATAREDVLRTKGRWEVDADDEFYKPPVWKQIILKVKAQARQANCGGTGEWVNYDSQSYEKNFDDGMWRDTSQNVFLESDESENFGLKERALHTALLQKFASSRSQALAGGELKVIISDQDLSPLPVRSALKPKDEFVPIWQRRATSPVTLDVRQRS